VARDSSERVARQTSSRVSSNSVQTELHENSAFIMLRVTWRSAIPAFVLVLCSPLSVRADCGATSYDCALFHVGRREFEEAVRYLDRQLTASPRDLKTLNLMGIALTGAGRRDAANERFRAALAVDPRFYPALKNLAVNEYDAGRVGTARAHFESVLKIVPADEVANLYLAEIHYEGKNLRKALPHYEKSGGRWAQDPTVALHYGRCLVDAGRTKEAVAVFGKIPAGAGASLFEAGVSLGQAKAHPEAARLFAAARKSYKDPYAAGYNQTLMLVEAGDGEGAVRAARELIAEGRAPAELWNLAARAYLTAGRVQEAYDALRQATRLEPKAAENYIDLASICVEHDNFDLGLEIVDIGLRQLPDSWKLYLQRGVLLAMKARLAEAEKEFETARTLAPGEPVPYAALGMVWMQSGQAEKAVEVLRAERPRSRDHVVPYIFAVALLRSGADAAAPEGTEALEALRASTKADPEFAPARAELGRLLLKRDEVDAGIAELEKAAALDPGATAALYALSQAYNRKGDRAKARQLLSRVSRLNEQERGDDPDRELRRAVFRIVREGTATAPRAPSTEP
jgi:tetratricopeptide (TPR) repeat protein